MSRFKKSKPGVALRLRGPTRQDVADPNARWLSQRYRFRLIQDCRGYNWHISELQLSEKHPAQLLQQVHRHQHPIYRFFEFAYIAMALFSVYLVVTHWETNRDRAYIFVFFGVVAIFMFFFKRRFRKNIEKRNQDQ
jgi:hypothetical protein